MEGRADSWAQAAVINAEPEKNRVSHDVRIIKQFAGYLHHHRLN
jgi:hypothetical protein